MPPSAPIEERNGASLHAHAVVIGAGIAGLSAAHALAPSFERITLVAGDVPDHAADTRFTMLVAGAHEALRALDSGLEARWIAAGAEHVDRGFDLARLQPSSWSPRAPHGHTMIVSSEAALVRSLAHSLHTRRQSIELLHGCEVVGLTACGHDWLQVSGVRLRSPSGEEETLDADLVVDASGRDSKARDWLDRLAHPAFRGEIEEATPSLRRAIAATFLRPPIEPGRRAGCRQFRGLSISHGERSERQLQAIALPLEGGRLRVTLELPDDLVDHAPRDAFAAALARVRSRVLADWLEGAKLLAGPERLPEHVHVRRPFEAAGLVGGFAAVGDAVLAPTATTALGPSCAVIGARVLAKTLVSRRSLGPAFTRAFFQGQHEALDEAWNICRSAEAAPSSAEAAGGRRRALVDRYRSAFLRAAEIDRGLDRALDRWLQLLTPQRSLTAPGVVQRVLAYELGARGKATEAGDGPEPGTGVDRPIV